jgi:hypothetical protein
MALAAPRVTVDTMKDRRTHQTPHSLHKNFHIIRTLLEWFHAHQWLFGKRCSVSP